MPVSVWQDVVSLHFPGSAWLRCRRETLDALSAFKAERALPTWDATLGALLAEAEAGRTPDAPPITAEPVTAEPNAAEPNATEPNATEPISTEVTEP
jgi:hypothetical protein